MNCEICGCETTAVCGAEACQRCRYIITGKSEEAKFDTNAALVLAHKCNELERERDEARECLREAMFVPALSAFRVNNDRWRKAAGLS